MNHILAIDQGTTGTTVLIFDEQGKVVRKTYREFNQIYPRPGWVEHDPIEIWQTVVDAVNELMSSFPHKIKALGITNQRETTVVWDRKSGKPIYNAIVWQCRRTSEICSRYRGHEKMIREKTGLPLDPYLSGTKIKWLLENVPSPETGDLAFGTIDTWLIWNLTGGKRHVTDHTNASRTLLYDLQARSWDRSLLDLFGIPETMLPEIKNSVDEFGTVAAIPAISGVPILGVAGDQQAALFGQRCFESGQAKNTYGTGCFMLVNTGREPIHSEHGLISTVAVDGGGQPCYALEGSIFIAGAVIQWLRDELRFISTAAESEAAAQAVADNGGVYFVPAFVGLGAPHWDPDARGVIVGLTRGTKREHLIRAALESMAYQTCDILNIMEKEAGTAIERLSVDGGATANEFLMQFQADILDRPVIRPDMAELTAMGAASLAGMSAGIWKNAAALIRIKGSEKHFNPKMDKATRENLLSGWSRALRQALTT
jgi:glycerol kinase